MNLILAVIVAFSQLTNATVKSDEDLHIYRAIHYNVGKMEEVIYNRSNPRSKHYTKGFSVRSGMAGYVAVPSCSRLGQIVLVQFWDKRKLKWGAWERHQVVDCTKEEDLAHHAYYNIGIETNGNTAKKYGFYLSDGGDGWTRARIWGYSK